MVQTTEQNSEAKTSALGAYCVSPSPELVELAGYMGYRYVIVDHMFTSVGWEMTTHMARAAWLSGSLPYVRVQTSPWTARGGDIRLGSEVARAKGVGAAGAVISFGSLEEIEVVLSLLDDNIHSRLHIIDDVKVEGRRNHSTTFDSALRTDFDIVPMIETLELVESLDKICSMPGVRHVNLGAGDLANVVGIPGGRLREESVWLNPEMVELIDEVVQIAERSQVEVWCNIGGGPATVQHVADSADELWRRGVSVVFTETLEGLLQYALRDVISETLAGDSIAGASYRPQSGP